MTWGPDVETNLAISSANHLKVRFIQQSLTNSGHLSIWFNLRINNFSKRMYSF
ncbi:hypothetical protein [Arsenophonus endosymbiont of Aphis craccivora]|uniref:hypothetical protein n=1 Tax=Arsenophonus endosymbiont of Aphis craccivora TaxID=1231049 RepID=UPI001EE27CEA|nr:hypothetical protein [Arsenophonus endosymbiont of Aphis craccivora]